MDYDIVILTPTYNRVNPLKTSINQLMALAESAKMTVCHIIINDGSENNYEKMINGLNNSNYYRIQYSKSRKNYGREGFWELHTNLYKLASKVQFRYAMILPDDFYYCPNFFTSAIKHFHRRKAKDKTIVAMNLMWITYKNWGFNRYIDCAYICRELGPSTSVIIRSSEVPG